MPSKNVKSQRRLVHEGRQEGEPGPAEAAATVEGILARMVLFLASDDAAMCTANNYMVEAGSI